MGRATFFLAEVGFGLAIFGPSGLFLTQAVGYYGLHIFADIWSFIW